MFPAGLSQTPPPLQNLPGRQGTHSSEPSRRDSWPPGQGRHAVQAVVLGKGEKADNAVGQALDPKHNTVPASGKKNKCYPSQNQDTSPAHQKAALSRMHRLKAPGSTRNEAFAIWWVFTVSLSSVVSHMSDWGWARDGISVLSLVAICMKLVGTSYPRSRCSLTNLAGTGQWVLKGVKRDTCDTAG